MPTQDNLTFRIDPLFDDYAQHNVVLILNDKTVVFHIFSIKKIVICNFQKKITETARVHGFDEFL